MPGLVVDTHALIWFVLGSPLLSAVGVSAIQACVLQGSSVALSSISIVEIVYLVEKGRVPREALSRLILRLEEAANVFEVVPLTTAVALNVQHVSREQVPDLPDRVIAATALHLGVPLLSRDRKIRLSGVPTIW